METLDHESLCLLPLQHYNIISLTVLSPDCGRFYTLLTISLWMGTVNEKVRKTISSPWEAFWQQHRCNMLSSIKSWRHSRFRPLHQGCCNAWDWVISTPLLKGWSVSLISAQCMRCELMNVATPYRSCQCRKWRQELEASRPDYWDHKA